MTEQQISIEEELRLLDAIVSCMEALPEEARERTYDYLNHRFPIKVQSCARSINNTIRYLPGPFGVAIYHSPDEETESGISQRRAAR